MAATPALLVASLAPLSTSTLTDGVCACAVPAPKSPSASVSTNTHCQRPFVIA